MKIKNYIYFAALLLTTILASCTSNDNESNETVPGTPVDVRIEISAYNSNNATRAWDGSLEASEEKELIRSWIVIVTNKATNAVENIIESQGTLNNVEYDAITEEIATGDKIMYAFANISKAQIESAIATSIQIGTAISLNTMQNATFAPNGNNWDGTNGIPMSNWQEVTISGGKENLRLYVCRMVSKIKFEITNITANDIKIKNISISDITGNSSAIKLMPAVSITDNIANGGQGAATLTPNLPNNVERTTVNALKGDGSDAVTIASGASKDIKLYVNESNIGSGSMYGMFQLTLNIDRGSSNEELRYAMVSNHNSNWTYIARNDYREIPITIDDYKLDLIPTDYPPIGVYPASVKEEDGVFTCTFHAKGKFSLIPVVTRYSTGEQILYGSDVNTWNYNDGSLTTSDANGIYSTAPYWNATDKCFEGETGNNTGKAYHEFTVKVNKGGSAQQTLGYKLWMIRE